MSDDPAGEFTVTLDVEGPAGKAHSVKFRVKGP